MFVFYQTALTVIFSVLRKFIIYREIMRQSFNYMQLACYFCHEIQLSTCRICQQFLYLHSAYVFVHFSGYIIKCIIFSVSNLFSPNLLLLEAVYPRAVSKMTEEPWFGSGQRQVTYISSKAIRSFFLSHSYRATWYYQSFIYSQTDALASCLKKAKLKFTLKLVRYVSNCFNNCNFSKHRIMRSLTMV